ncbi:MAG: GAF domain-containing protein [Nitrospinae bacterium]|nr:GAF domain-containing protein [Nitrospinota bacterium]
MKYLQNESLARIGQMALSLDLDLSLLMETAVKFAAKSLDVEYSKILELLPGGDRLLLKAGVGWKPGLVGQAAVGSDLDSQAGYTLKSNHPVVVEDLRTETRFSGPALLNDHQVVSGLSVIIKIKDRPYGVFGAHTRRLRQFTEDDINFLGALANVISMALSRKEMENDLRVKAGELERSNKELRDFAYVASHDLQEPLRKILTFSDRLSSSSNLDGQNRDYLIRIQNAAERMRNLLDSLLEYSKVTMKDMAFQQIDLAKIVSETVEDLEDRIRDSNGTIEIGPLPSLKAEPCQMRQLFQNLISNGLKFRRDGVNPVIQIGSCKKKNGDWEITVRDNGIGFEEKYAPRLFRLFERLHGHGPYQGAGMGLAICKKIVDRHNGAISVKSSPHQGATFFITLPE